MKNTIKKRKANYWLYLMIGGLRYLAIKKPNPVVTELFTKTYFAVPKNIRLSFTHFFIMKSPNKQHLQQIAFNHYSAIDYRGFALQNHIAFLVIYATLDHNNWW